ncbi:MAG: hypothetical protein L6290_01125 [Thermodesulfovibrionales bacterium]|nr:hypothetical protein [Thermodesulfovibrionales bacterium]
MKKTVDVAINVYGKPYQTLAALKTLMLHSGEHIDRIYFIQERKQPPWGANFDIVLQKFENIELFVPEHFLFVYYTERAQYKNKDYRLSIRYQYAWENTDKNYLYITHNDMMYTDDIVGAMLKVLRNGEYVGVGQIGRCWECPAFHGKKCSGDTYLHYTPTYEEVLALTEKYPHKKSQEHDALIDRTHPMPLPSCRVNEWACLINLEKVQHEVVPFGIVDPFGAMIGIDTATQWFRDLTVKGFRFKNMDIDKYCRHGWGKHPGHETSCNSEHYTNAEDEAVVFLEDILREDLNI